jgi:leader peptidase (prepilin peptidase)/N-methyltransferase
MNPLLPLAVLIGVLGLAVGSFLNVVIYRVPAHESIVSPGSHCPRCETPIKGRHNVPVLGWLALRGRCYSCSLPISARYPLVEAGTAALFVAFTVHFGASPALPAFLFLAAMGISLAMIDVDHRWLPDSLVLPSYIVAVVLLMPAAAATGEWHSAVRALAGMIAFLALFAALAFIHPLGLGLDEVLLAGLLGLFLGWLSWPAVLIAALVTIVVAGAGGRVLGAARRIRRTLPVGSCLVAATVLSVFVTAPLAQWYGALIPT